MTNAAGTSFTDLLINQPILVWSLAGGLAILVIAGFLSIFLTLRSRFKKKKVVQEATKVQRQAEAKKIKAAVSELKSLSDDKSAAKEASDRQPDIDKATGASNGAQTSEKNSFLQTNTDSGSEPGESSGNEDPLEDGEAGSGIEEEAEEEQNELAALFQTDVIIDPHLQALRDNLPAITIDELLTNIRSVSSELREHINAEHVAQS